MKSWITIFLFDVVILILIMYLVFFYLLRCHWFMGTIISIDGHHVNVINQINTTHKVSFGCLSIRGRAMFNHIHVVVLDIYLINFLFKMISLVMTPYFLVKAARCTILTCELETFSNQLITYFPTITTYHCKANHI